MTLTGEQIDTLLETQFVVERVLEVSDGFSYTWDASMPVGSRVDPATTMLDGMPVDPTGEYRVTVNSFLADGGDGFAILTEGTNRLGGAQDIDSMVDYFAELSPVDPPAADRISVINN